MQIKKLTVFFVVISFSPQLFSQESSGYTIRINGLYGKIRPHTEVIRPLIQNAATGGEIAIERQTQGKKAWEQYSNFPVTGIGLLMLNLGNRESLGTALAAYPYIHFPLIRNKHFTLNFKTGAGISTVTKNYRNTANTGNQNRALGSAINIYAVAGAALDVPLAKHISLSATYNWSHLSNGSLKKPNAGLNILHFSGGVRYTPAATNQIPEKKELPDLPRNYSVEITLSGGIRQMFQSDNRHYGISSLQAAFYKPLSNLYRMGIGADIFYNGSYDGKTEYAFTYLKENKFKNKIRAGISWQNELVLGRLVAGLHTGIYLYDPIKNLEPYKEVQEKGRLNKGIIYPYNIKYADGWLYTRISGKYFINKKLYAAIGLKTHMQRAEFIEWGMGYRF